MRRQSSWRAPATAGGSGGRTWTPHPPRPAPPQAPPPVALQGHPTLGSSWAPAARGRLIKETPPRSRRAETRLQGGRYGRLDCGKATPIRRDEQGTWPCRHGGQRWQRPHVHLFPLLVLVAALCELASGVCCCTLFRIEHNRYNTAASLCGAQARRSRAAHKPSRPTGTRRRLVPPVRQCKQLLVRLSHDADGNVEGKHSSQDSRGTFTTRQDSWQACRGAVATCYDAVGRHGSQRAIMQSAVMAAAARRAASGRRPVPFARKTDPCNPGVPQQAAAAPVPTPVALGVRRRRCLPGLCPNVLRHCPAPPRSLG